MIIEPLHWLSISRRIWRSARSWLSLLLSVLLFTMVLVPNPEPFSIFMRSFYESYDCSSPFRNYSISSKECWTSSARSRWPLELFTIKSCFRSIFAYGLSIGLILRHSLTKELNSSDHFWLSLNPCMGLSLSCHIAINGLR